jgi:type II pantothenate kinase
MFKICLNNTIRTPSQKLGIDMGQSLSKLAYLEENELILSSFPTHTSVSFIRDFLKSKKNQFNSISFTGGKSFKLYHEYSRIFNSKLINEFKANVRGIEYLYHSEKQKDLPISLVVTIGTGTSIVLKNTELEHIGGTALGGGFFMGIIKLLFGLDDFQQAINLAKKGTRYNLDLKVSDIYEPEDNRVDLLFKEFTAASLGKVDGTFNIANLKKEDFLNSIICLIGENIGLMAILMATNKNVKNIVFSGGFLKDNRIIKKILSPLCKINQKKAFFLKNSEFSAAIGALLV